MSRLGLAVALLLPTSLLLIDEEAEAQIILLWSDTLTAADTSFVPTAFQLDGSSGIHVAGNCTATSGAKALFVARIDSVGTWSWSNRIDCEGNTQCDLCDLDVDGESNSYVSAQMGPGPAVGSSLFSYATDGGLRWGVSDGERNGDWIYPSQLECDGDAHFYTVRGVYCGDTCESSYYIPAVRKYDTSGSLIWERLRDNPLMENSDVVKAYDLALDPFGNVLATGGAPPSTTPHTYDIVYTFSYDTSGTRRWSRFFPAWDYDNDPELGLSVVADSSGDVWVGAVTESLRVHYPTLIAYDALGYDLGHRRYTELPTYLTSLDVVFWPGQGVIMAAGAVGGYLTTLVTGSLDSVWLMVEQDSGTISYLDQGVCLAGPTGIYRWFGTEVRRITADGTVAWAFTAPFPIRGLLSMPGGSFVICGSIGDATAGYRTVVSRYGACSCPCYGDPVCDSVTDILDVVSVTGIAFRGEDGGVPGYCPSTAADINCNGSIDIIDVIRFIDVAFRGVDPITVLCAPCDL